MTKHRVAVVSVALAVLIATQHLSSNTVAAHDSIGRSNVVPSAEDLIAGHKQLIERAHAHGLRIYGATLTPFEGAAYFTAEGEAKRQAVNAFIRTGRAYDGVIDFDAAVRDPAAPSKIQQKFNPGDNLHMNDAGYQAMAAAIDLGLFKASGRSTR